MPSVINFDGGGHIFMNIDDGSVSSVIISIAVMLFGGFLMTRITKLLRLPNVTAYIVFGIIIGPYALNLIPQSVMSGTEFLPDIALAFIAFGTGEFFRLSVLRKNGLRVLVITTLEALAATLLVFVVTYFVLGIDLAFSAVLAALAAATAPASTMMTIRQTGSKGDFVDTLLQVVALDDVVGLIAYSVAISIALAGSGEGGFEMSNVIKPIIFNIIVLLLGGIFGVLLTLLMNKRSNDNRLIVSIAMLFAFCGICSFMEVSPLLGCMSMGMVYINISDDDKLFKQLNYFSPPILLLFFVRSGIGFDLGALTGGSSFVGSVPLIVVGVVYFFVRIIGKYVGSFVGCAMVHKSKPVRNYLGLALIPQAGVAIGLAALGARMLGGEMGNALETVILASSVLYELIGPVCAKLSLYLTHSYSTKLEDITEGVSTSGEERELTEVEILTERIREIRKRLSTGNGAASDEDEAAFLEAAEEQYAIHGNFGPKRGLINRK